MNKSSIMKVAAAIALLFAVNMEADAQLGKLKGLAKKAKEAVTTTTTVTDSPVGNVVADDDDDNGSSASSSDNSGRRPGETEEQYKRRSMREFHKNNPTKLEEMDIEDAGSLANYFGVKEGSDSAIVCYLAETDYVKLDPKYKTQAVYNTQGCFKKIVEFWRHCKNHAAFQGFDPKFGGEVAKRNFKSAYIGYKANGRYITPESLLNPPANIGRPEHNFAKNFPKEYKIIIGFYKQAVATYESMYGSLANVKANDH